MNSIKTLKVERKTVVEQVMDNLKKLIASGEYAPGTKLPSEPELAEIFGVGRSTIREALKIFQYLGVVESKTGSGTFILERSNISRETLTWAFLLGKTDVYNFVELREVLELRGYKNLIMNKEENRELHQEVCAMLKQDIKMMSLAIDNNDMEGLCRADYSFHGHVICGADNELFNDVYTTLEEFMLKEILETNMYYGNLDKVLQDHTDLLNNLESGDMETALKLFDTHICGVRKKLHDRY